jgi:hypothetical protein
LSEKSIESENKFPVVSETKKVEKVIRQWKAKQNDSIRRKSPQNTGRKNRAVCKWMEATRV